MPGEGAPRVLYWDASALLSTLVTDAHTAAAQAYLRDHAQHLVASLAAAETLAVLARIERQSSVDGAAIAAAREGLLRGPWRWTRVAPEAATCAALARRHRLRGADLWHLAAAVTLRESLPELTFLTFDAALRDAADTEGLIVG